MKTTQQIALSGITVNPGKPVIPSMPTTVPTRLATTLTKHHLWEIRPSTLPPLNLESMRALKIAMHVPDDELAQLVSKANALNENSFTATATTTEGTEFTFEIVVDPKVGQASQQIRWSLYMQNPEQTLSAAHANITFTKPVGSDEPYTMSRKTRSAHDAEKIADIQQIFDTVVLPLTKRFQTMKAA